MPLSSPSRRSRAIDGDPTLASSSWSPTAEGNERHIAAAINNHRLSIRQRTGVGMSTRQQRWQQVSSPQKYKEVEDSFETPAYKNRVAKPRPFIIPVDQDSVSSIDRPLDASRLELHHSVNMTSSSPEPGDLPSLNIGNKLSPTTPSPTKPKLAAVTPPSPSSSLSSSTNSSSPDRYKRHNPNVRREFAKKILEHRKKMAAFATHQTDNETKEYPANPSGVNASPPRNYGKGPLATKLSRLTNTATENDVYTKSPESTDDTVSWASTLTTDPSRLITSSTLLKPRSGEDASSGLVPYLRMEALPSVAETEEPQGKLDRHLYQQRSITSQSSSKQRRLQQQEEQQQQQLGTQRRLQQQEEQQQEQQQQPETPLSVDHNIMPRQQRDEPEREEYPKSNALDQRDDQGPSIRRMYSGSQSEANEVYPRSDPDRSATHSDPGVQWPHTAERRPSPLINYGNSDDVLVTLHPGGETFEHSSHILAYASPVLRQKLQPVLGGWYRLDLDQTSAVEWQLIQPFLEPHSVQSAVVTPSNLSHLLPWFVQLKLDILLAESDQLLVTLEFPKAYSAEGAAASLASVGDKSTPPAPMPTVKDMIDVLLLTEISALAKLQGTCEASLETVESYLALHPGLVADSEALPILMRLLRDHPAIRQRLWRRSLVRFLPSDLPVFNEKEKRTTDAELVIVETMVYNSLFPFLLREGLNKAAKQDENERKTMELEERWKRFRERQQKVSQTPRVWNAAMRENSIIEATFMDDDNNGSTTGSLSLSKSERESVNTSKLQGNTYLLSESPLMMMMSSIVCDDGTPDDFAEWWRRCSGGDPLLRLGDSAKPKSSLQQSLASIRSRAESQRLKEEIEEITKSERSRTNWLELILRRLNRPPIFPLDDNEDGLMMNNNPNEPGVPLPSGAQKDRRKFLC